MRFGSVDVSVFFIFELLFTNVTGCWLLGKMKASVVSASMTNTVALVSAAVAYEIAVNLGDPISFILFFASCSVHHAAVCACPAASFAVVITVVVAVSLLVCIF